MRSQKREVSLAELLMSVSGALMATGLCLEPRLGSEHLFADSSGTPIRLLPFFSRDEPFLPGHNETSGSSAMALDESSASAQVCPPPACWWTGEEAEG